MFEVKIYIETSLQGPAKKEGAYVAIIEYIKKSGEPETRQIEGYIDSTTFHESTLRAMTRALGRLEKECHVILYTNCPYVKRAVEGDRLDAWQAAGWKRADGKEIKNKKLWSIFQAYRNLHDIEVHFSKHHEYKRLMQDELKKIQEASEKCRKTLKTPSKDGISKGISDDSAKVG